MNSVQFRANSRPDSFRIGREGYHRSADVDLRRLSQCPLDGPTTPETLFDAAAIQAGESRPFHDRASFAVVFKMMIPARVIRLLLRASPATIVFRIWPAAIFTVQCVTWRSWSHIRKELFKAVQPFSGHRDTATSVIWIVSACCEIAPLFRRTPRLIFTRTSASMRSSSFRSTFTSKASATARPAETQALRSDGLRASTVATTFPYCWLLMSTGQLSQYDEASKSLAEKVNASHGVIISRKAAA